MLKLGDGLHVAIEVRRRGIMRVLVHADV